MNKWMRLLVSGLLGAGCSHATSNGSAGTRLGRGTVVVQGTAVRAIARGPVLIHAYVASAGGTLHHTPALTGTEADCLDQAAMADTRSELVADRRLAMAVPEGHLACFMADRPIELLWHAHAHGVDVSDQAPPTVAAR